MRIRKCRICGNKKLSKVGSLGKLAISDFTKKPSEGHKYPLELIYCNKCTLLQLAHNTPRELLYKDYWYESSINPVVVADLKEIAGQVQEGPHIDIGANDGTLLKYSKGKGYRIAVDPSNIKPGKFYWIKDYWENVDTMKVNTITAIACLYDLPDPNKFIKNVKKHLIPNGIFISQFQPLAEMIELNDLGNICHEHLEYYSYKSLKILFERNGLEIYKVEKNTMNGGSYRVFARHYKKGSIKFKEKLYRLKDFKLFMYNITIAGGYLRMFLSSVENVYGYGASTKANTILQYYGVRKLAGIVDVNKRKIGKYMINSEIPIIGKIPKNAEWLWVFPYGFKESFKKKEKKYKGDWFTTIPEFIKT